MLVIPGSSVHSIAKRQVLLNQVQASCPSITSLDAFWIHLVKSTNEDAEQTLLGPSTDESAVLRRLLDYGYDDKLTWTNPAFQHGQNVVYVTPRPGSVSPWSSKATDIACICHLGPWIERIERGVAFVFQAPKLSQVQLDSFSHLLHDRMTQSVSMKPPREELLFSHHSPRPLRSIHMKSTRREEAIEMLAKANRELGLALSSDEIDYLVTAYVTSDIPIDHEPTDAELFMFAQVNSEHCRHKIFNAAWTIDSQPKDMSLFQMIRNTEKRTPTGTISAYSDNAAVLQGNPGTLFRSLPRDGRHIYGSEKEEDVPILIKVETHNHPTAVSPYPGAATGSGGEIRDEGAVGRGSKPKAGLAGFTVSDLLIPDFVQPWENKIGRPLHIASALEIMIDGPLGASAFNNEFGRPCLAGYFRTFCQDMPMSLDGDKRGKTRGYHKPIMIAGGYGNVRPQFSKKSRISPGAPVVVLGGPGLLIGLGGGAASSQISGASSAELDFASVQRDNAEMQRRCQQVIDACISLNETNPIESIHDVGAGGLSNALPELVHDSGLGASFEIRDVLVADSSMSPMEIWCNESQERYVLAISPARIDAFTEIANRERCPYSIVGSCTEEDELVVTDRLFNQDVIRLKMSTLFGKPPKMTRNDHTRKAVTKPFDTTLCQFIPSLSITDSLDLAINRVLRLPSVASKSFLITIGDRSITGLVARDQMVGPFQVPVADVAVTLSTYGFEGSAGEAMAMGERTPLALLSAAASARMAVAESLLNLSAARLCDNLTRIKLSANWMCAAGVEGEGAALYEAVEAIGMDLCPALGIGIPVGKDSMSMSMKWREEGEAKEVTAPLSLIVTAFSPVQDAASTWTPQLHQNVGEPTVLILVDLAKGKTRLGGSALTQVFQQLGTEAPDVEDASLLRSFINGCQLMRMTYPDLILAYHDRSDGGLLTTIAEMSFAGRIGVTIVLDESDDPIPTLFNEELGAVFQVRESHLDDVAIAFGMLPESFRVIGHVLDNDDQTFTICHGTKTIYTSSRGELQKVWAETSYRMQSVRDDKACADSEYSLIAPGLGQNPRLFYDLSFTPIVSTAFSARPKVAVLREQGVNGHIEMAFAFTAAGFDAIDVHMSDILSSRITLADFTGLVACGGFSYGDVLGAGKGWANSVLLNPVARKEFKEFMERMDTFVLGVCNGCQFLSHLREIVPIEQGADNWPQFKPNASGRFEGRTVMVEIPDSEATKQSPFFGEMIASKLPIAVAHGEGRAAFSSAIQQTSLAKDGGVALRYLGGTEVYPLNPNGSIDGIAGVQSKDGRILAIMPHPERNVDLRCCSWYPKEMLWEDGWNRPGVGGPWLRMFQTARRWCA